jgi:preprotein translocase subunit SecE
MRSIAGIVAIGFILAGLVVSYVLSHAFHWLFLTLGVIDHEVLGDQFTVSTLLAALLSLGTAFGLWRSQHVNGLAQEVVVEMRKVTWPSVAETRAATLVVILTSFLISMVLGFFDLGFNWVIDRIF